jgi:hypothetical protein
MTELALASAAASPCFSSMAFIACWHVPGAPGQPLPKRFSR